MKELYDELNAHLQYLILRTKLKLLHLDLLDRLYGPPMRIARPPYKVYIPKKEDHR